MFGKPVLLFDNVFNSDSEVTVLYGGTAVGDYDVHNLYDWRPYTWWKSELLSPIIKAVPPAPASANYWMIWGHDLFTQGSTITLRKYDDVLGLVIVDTVVPTSNAPILRFFNAVTADYFTITIQAPGGAPSLAIVAVGSKLEFPRYLKRGFDPIGRKSKGTMNKSHNGQPLGTVIKYRQWSESITFNNVLIDFVREFETAYESHLDNTPFVFAWDPTDHVDELYLCDPLDSFSAPHTGGLFASLKFKLTGLA